MPMKRGIGAVIAIFALLWASPVLAQEKPLQEVAFIPQWLPQAQFAGYYVAFEKGFYEKRGLKVKILRGGPQCPSSRALEEGAADFATMFLTTAMERRANGSRLVNLAQVVQKSALMLVAKKSSGILSPKDMDGRRVSMWKGDFALQPGAFFRKYGLSVEVVPQSSTLNLFLRGGVDVASAMWYNEYHAILNAGLDPGDLTVFLLADHGMNFPEDGIYCMEETFEKNPGLCCHFAEASLEGWRHAFENPQEALDIVMQYVREANVATNRIHQKWMLSRMKDIILPGGKEKPAGTLDPENYDLVAQELIRFGAVTSPPSFSDFTRNCPSHAAQ